MSDFLQPDATDLGPAIRSNVLLDEALIVLAADGQMLEWLDCDAKELIGREVTAVFPELKKSSNQLKQIAQSRQGSCTLHEVVPTNCHNPLTFVFTPFMLAGKLLSLTAFPPQKQVSNKPQKILDDIILTAEPRPEQAKLSQQADLIEKVQDAIISADIKLKIISWNKAAERIYGWRSEEVVGKLLYEIVPTTFPEQSVESVIETLANVGQWKGLMIQKRKDGETLYIQSASTLLLNSDNQPMGVVAVNRDITQHQLVEERIRQAEEHYRRLFDEAPIMYATTLMDGAIISDCNYMFCQTLGYRREEVINQPLFSFYTEESRQKAEIGGYQQALSGNFMTQEREFLTKTGRIVSTLLSASPMADKQGAVIGTRTMYVDISTLKATEAERERLFNELNEAHERLRLLSRNQVETQEMERRRIARELHDEIGQTLTAVKLQLQSMQRLFDEPDTQEHLGESIVVVDQALMQVRDISLNLRPSLLDDFGLVATLRWYVDRQSQWAQFEATFHTNMESERLPSELESVCFRIMQEALTNIIRHSRAKSILISVEKFTHQLVLRIQDDGIGFDVDQAFDDAIKGNSLGLLGMEERVLLVNGSLTISSSKQTGSLIKVLIPLLD